MDDAGQTVDLSTQFKRSVVALAAIDEPWIALSVLADTDLDPGQRVKATEVSFQTVERSFAELAIAIDTAGVLSNNEELDDVPTSSIKFLLVPYLVSRLNCAYQGEPKARLERLQVARKNLIDFLHSVDDLGLLSKKDRDHVLDESIEVVLTAQQKRDEKITRFKAEKEAERKLQVILERVKTHSSATTAVDDEEAIRDASLTVLRSAIRKGLDDIASIDQEVQLLQFAVKERAKGRDPGATAKAARRNAPSTVMDGLPATFRIVDRKEEMRRGVFRPSHSLPTYTVEEWGEIELERAKKREQEQKEREIVRAREAEEEDSDDAADRETMEKRSWDNWRDEHNKGSGNTLR